MKKILIVLSLLLLVIIIMAVPKYIKDLQSAKKKISSYITRVINTPTARVEYYRTGEGYPILISHGITGGFDQGLGLAETYIDDGYDIIAVSRFGYLNSEIPEDSSPDAQADVYEHLLNELGIDKVFMFGNSAGTAAAVKFALKYPDRCQGLILVSSNVPSVNKAALPPRPVMKVVFGSDFAYWASVSLAKYRMLSAVGLSSSFQESLSNAQKDQVLNGVLKPVLPVSLRTKGILNDLYVSNPAINKEEYKFEQIKVPVIMVHAKDDTLCSYDGAVAVSQRISDVTFVDFESGGHLILGHERQIQQTIEDFVNSKVP